MQRFYRLLLSVAGIALLANPAVAQVPPKDAPSSDPKGKLVNVFGGGDMAQAAADLRKAGEAFARFGDSLEAISSTIAEAIVQSSEHHAIMSRAFDPFGFKTAFRTIGQQNETIQALHKAETERLRKECEELKRKLGRLERKMEKRKNNKRKMRTATG